MTGHTHYTTLTALYATVAVGLALAGDGSMAALHALIALEYWRQR